MSRDQLMELVDAAMSDGASVESVTKAVEAIDRLVAWCEMRRVTCAHALAAMHGAPHEVLAKVSRVSTRDAERVVHRADTLAAAPDFGDALAVGDISVGHVDVLDRAVRQLTPSAKQQLLDSHDQLLAHAVTSSIDEFARHVRRQIRLLDPGEDRFQRQQRAVRLWSRVDPDDGMHCWTLRLDPRTGLTLYNSVVTMTERLFRDRVPEHCPTDPLDRQSFLRAHALLALIDGAGTSPGAPEFVCVIDTTVASQPVVDWGLPVELPDNLIRQLWPTSVIHGVVVRNGVVIHAPGQLDMGRRARVANRAQRRALRALYSTCAIPGCDVRFDLCHVHHIEWWERGGTTDMDNLIPVCNRHHHDIHSHDWRIELDRCRRITVTRQGLDVLTGRPTRGGP